MDLRVARELDSPSVISDDVGGETLAINLQTGSYYVIPPTGREVWQAISGGVPAASLLDGPDDPRAVALAALVRQAVEAGLLRESAEVRSPAGVAWSADGLQIEEHKDMADLLGLDPIHEADENIGWPKAPGNL